MKLKQLECVMAVVKCGFNVTAASEKLFISQPAVSKHIKLLEEAMGMPIFRRQSRSFIGLTELGESILPEIERVISAAENIKALSKNDFSGELSLSFATTSTLARYRLNHILPAYQQQFTHMPLHIHEGSNMQILQLVNENEADFGWFSAGDLTPYHAMTRQLVMLPAESWSAIAVVPKDHSLCQEDSISLKELSKYPLVSYITSHKGPSAIVRQFHAQGLDPKIVMTARNPDMIKNYVRQGIGIGIIAEMAYNSEDFATLTALSLKKWLQPFNTYLVWRIDKHLRQFHYELIESIVPGADVAMVKQHVRKVQANEESGWAI